MEEKIRYLSYGGHVSNQQLRRLAYKMGLSRSAVLILLPLLTIIVNGVALMAGDA